MLNRAARYFPILDELRKYFDGDCRILEIGSGPQGIGQFNRRSFVGCDVTFTTKPKAPMIPVICSGSNLPFANGSFDVVIASDVMEHLAPEQREKLIAEALRVTQEVAIFGFPCGSPAFELDQKLLSHYRKQRKRPPAWLEEHMLYPFPDRNLFQSLPDGWSVRSRPNESLSFHYWVMCKEMLRPWNYAFRLAVWMMPGVVRRVLRSFDDEPSYRTIFVVTRAGRQA